MAKPLILDRREEVVDVHERVIEEYREALARKPDLPAHEYPPVVIGPTWQLDANGYWLLPERTLGWDVIGWCGSWLQHTRGKPWRFTLEQARFVLWWFALERDGSFCYRDGVLQRLKGWGKDPLGACLCAVELLGPCRFEEWWHGDEPVATDRPNAWVQTCATAITQTRNTMRFFPILFPQNAPATERFGLQIGKETLYALGGSRFLEAHTSSPRAMEGNQITFALANETHLWYESNDGHEMAAVIRRNAAKAEDASSRSLRITNAYQPGEDSVAERDREAWEKMAGGESLTTGLLYDSIEAAPEAALTAEVARKVVPSIRGDSIWLQPESVVKEILDTRNPPSQSRRWWYNQITAAEDAWTTPQLWDVCADRELALQPGDQIVEFFDGSKSDDATALVACRVPDGAVFFRGCWQRPANAPGWTVPRDQVDNLIRRDHEKYDVVAIFGDPGLGDDESGERYWDAYLDGWGRDFGGDGADPERLCLWAIESGPTRHAVAWDMSERQSTHIRLFTEAAERTATDISERQLVHDGNRLIRAHVGNARRRPNSYGVSIGKESRMSQRKIDLAVCVVGARMLRRMYLALPESKQRQKRRKVGVTFV